MHSHVPRLHCCHAHLNPCSLQQPAAGTALAQWSSLCQVVFWSPGMHAACCRLRVADGLVLGLYLLAYVCNLLATPIDDQLTFEARRDLGYWALPLQQAFLRKVSRQGDRAVLPAPVLSWHRMRTSWIVLQGNCSGVVDGWYLKQALVAW